MLVVVYFVILAVAFFFLIVLPQRRRNQALNALVASIEVGDEVITSGGIFGTVIAMESDRVDLQIAPGVVITVAKRALAQPAYPVPELAPAADEDDDADAADDSEHDGEQG
ncbi:MAG: preprotein translocase subunit YajC [Acidimicrobiia bacterium]